MAQVKFGEKIFNSSLLSRQKYTYIRDHEERCVLQKRSDNVAEIIQKETRELFKIIDDAEVDVRMMMTNTKFIL